MKNILQDYIPFEHDNLDYINGLINFAREQKNKNTAESILASAVIYTNLAEYLATHLIKNIRHIIYLVSYFQLRGVVFIKSEYKSNVPKTLGLIKSELEYYEFPDKAEFLKLIDKFNKARNNLFHKLLDKRTQEEISKLDKDLLDMQSTAEEILQKYNVITTGIATIWKQVTTPQPVENQKEEIKK